MTILPKRVRIREVGPREGIQTARVSIPTESKLQLISLLSQSGIGDIEITSMVRPDRVPQMADCEDVIKKYEKMPGVRYTALYLNAKGFERAEELGSLDNEGWINLAASDTFLAKNANTSLDAIFDSLPVWFGLFKKHNKKFRGIMLSTAFGCAYEGAIAGEKVLEIVNRVSLEGQAAGCPLQEVCLADTVGMANPYAIKSLINAVRNKFPQIELSLHLHDTRGLGIANAYAGLEEGITIFDASVGGVGGCPFTPQSAGNICTEDLIYLCHSLGIETGVSLEKYVEAARFAEEIFGQPLLGHVYKTFKR